MVFAFAAETRAPSHYGDTEARRRLGRNDNTGWDAYVTRVFFVAQRLSASAVKNRKGGLRRPFLKLET